jgi:hypothetical protein
MDSIAFSMAESGTLEILKKWDNTNFWEIFARMYDLRRTDLERQNKKPMLPLIDYANTAEICVCNC